MRSLFECDFLEETWFCGFAFLVIFVWALLNQLLVMLIFSRLLKKTSKEMIMIFDNVSNKLYRFFS